MGGLLYKEFYKNRYQLLALYTVGILCIIAVITRAFPFIGLNTAASYLFLIWMTYSIQIGCFPYDETKRWAIFVQSTPMAANGQVKSKYLFVLILSFIAMSVCLIADQFHMAFRHAATEQLLIEMLTCMVLFLNALEIPLVIRFGVKKGNMLRMVLFIGVAFAFITFLMLGTASATDSIERIGLFVERLLNGEMGTGMTWFVAMVPYVTLGLFYGSYRLSCILYAKGAENYEA